MVKLARPKELAEKRFKAGFAMENSLKTVRPVAPIFQSLPKRILPNARLDYTTNDLARVLHSGIE
jgi:hypothetical protein